MFPLRSQLLVHDDMKKYLPYIFILLLVVVLITPVSFAHADCGITSPGECVGQVIAKVLAIVFQQIQRIAALIMGLAGIILNFVVDFTITKMAVNISGIKGINTTWQVVRDLMNMAFIFLLVYEAIKIIIGESTTAIIRKLIIGIVLASILINFSLFFTKVMIDASNVVTIGFYNNIIDPKAPPVGAFQAGLADAYQRAMGLQGFFGSQALPLIADSGDGYSYLVASVGASILFLIVAFVFLAITVLLIIRYVVLIFLLALSPIAYMGIGLPVMKPYAHEWWESLKGQLLFAPLFMILNWITLTLIAKGLGGALDYSQWPALVNTTNAAANSQAINLLFNFALIIGLTIASLIISKKVASQGSKLIGQATSGLTTFAGGVIFGGSAAVGRSTIGRFGSNTADDAQLQKDAAEKRGLSGAWARTKLYTARTARDATYDVRNASVPTSVVGDVVEGTIGRTRAGKAMGLNDVNIPNIAVGAPISNIAGTGKGASKGYAEQQKEKDKRIRDRETANAIELALAQAKKDVMEGAAAGATPKQIDAMEKSLSKLSDKQTEALVASNRQLLASQEFANKISVKQLEALNKSDQFSDTEKDKLKDKRFDEIQYIDDAAGLASLAVPVAARTPAQVAAATRVETARGRIKGLSDSEIEMLDTQYLSNNHFVSELRSTQVDSINKSNKFPSGQKRLLKNTRLAPLLDALDNSRTTHAPNPALVRRMITKDLSAKDVAGLMSTNATFTDHTGATVTKSVLTHPEVMEQYQAGLLKRIGQEMTPSDITTIRDAINAAAAVPGASPNIVNIAAWINSQDGINNFS